MRYQPQNLLGGIAAKVGSFFWSLDKKPCYPFLSKLAESGRPLDALVGNVLGVAVGASVNYAQAAVHIIDFYIDDARAKERAHIISLAKSKDAASAELLRGYVCEAMRTTRFSALCLLSYATSFFRFEATVPRSVA